MSLIESITAEWGWTGIEPEEIVSENDFGNLIVRDIKGRYWRICPEDLRCERVADNREEIMLLLNDQEFLHDWYMTALVEDAQARLGPLGAGRKYCLKIPSVLGGEYVGQNLGMIGLDELIRTSGYIAKEIDNLPDGAKVEFKIVD